MKIFKRIMIAFFSVLILLAVSTALYMQHPKFGRAPRGERLERLRRSPNFTNNSFQNRKPTPMISEGYSMTGVIYNFLFKKYPRTKPSAVLPSVKTNLKRIPLTNNVLIWFGHSSYFLQLDGIRFLVDPIFSGNASPVPFSTISFPGTDVYSVEDMPDIDFLLITHDHYDHLDYETILKLKNKVEKVICGLGVGEHFEYWKYAPTIIDERDWNETVKINDKFELHTAPARHFSGRSLKSNNTLWLSFVLKTPGLKIYLGGDSGYDTHFKEIGDRFGGFDLALLDNGQYNPAWEEIHMLPEQVLKASQELRAKRLIPIHSSKFKLAYHSWDDPLKTIIRQNKSRINIATPKIGEIVYLDDNAQRFEEWWASID